MKAVETLKAKLHQVLRTNPSISMAIKYLYLRTSPIDSTESSPQYQSTISKQNHDYQLVIHKSSCDTRKTVRVTRKKSKKAIKGCRHLAQTSYPSFTSSTSDPKELNSLLESTTTPTLVSVSHQSGKHPSSSRF